MSNETAQDTTATYVAGTAVHVSPTDLLVDTNIRDAKPDANLVKSVREVGVLQPVVAVVTTENVLRVRFGARRTLAAIEAERDIVPVYVAGPEGQDKTEHVARIITQRDENTHRTGLTTSEEVGVVEQLTAFGLSAAQVAKQARIKRSDVDAALTVSGSQLARKASARYTDLTLGQVAVVADFQDEPETVKALVVAAHEGRFEHVAQRARDDREDTQARGFATEALTERGVRVIDRPSHDSRTSRLSYLSDVTSGEPLNIENHAQCPGHVAWLAHQWVWVDTDGNPLAEDGDLTEERADAAHQERRWGAEYACEDPAQYGHQDRCATTTQQRTPAADLSGEEREQAKQARALVIENNRAWNSATTVRRAWLADFAKRKTVPKGTAAFLAVALSLDTHALTSGGGNELAAGWLGKKHPGFGHADLSPAKSTTENRALVIALVQVLAAYEAQMTKDTWRHDGTHNAAGRHLRFQQRSGYTLAEVEQYAISSKTA